MKVQITKDKEIQLPGVLADLLLVRTRTLMIPAAVTAEAVDAIDAGSASATYTAEATLSGMNFGEVDAHCRGFSYMVVDEDERPDNYRCQAVFENRSSFTVDLTKTDCDPNWGR